ncbi:MAG: chromosomal replication initiator protein DnaA [Lachnospiraceae bacterium]|nr:chromosomal replication initiator protein DnaA [Lachnospiraceae bacterium]
MLDKIKENWSAILEKVRDDLQLTNVSYNTWLLPLEPRSLNGGVLKLFYAREGADQVLKFIKTKYGFYLQYAIEELTGQRCELAFVSTQEDEKPAERREERAAVSSLNPKYTFDNFVVGNSNMLAHSASLAVAEAPGEMYNPLFIYGDVGLGKTHLMQSIGHFVLKQNPQAKVLYVTCEKFMTEMIDSIRKKTNIEFREKYRYIDLLLIDDIQFIQKKEGTQEEFFHTFSALYEAKKQIVIASDRPPKDIDNLDDRLRSRFSSGLVVDIGLPDYETRVAILHKKEETEGYNIDNEVIGYIATNIKSNIRELEGALNKVVATSRLMRVPIDLAMAQNALQDIITPEAAPVASLPYILQTVSEQFGVPTSDILSKKRDKNYVLPRHVFIYLAKKHTDSTQKVIGQFLGGLDHSSVIHGIRSIEDKIKTDDNLRNTIDILDKKLSV